MKKEFIKGLEIPFHQIGGEIELLSEKINICLN